MTQLFCNPIGLPNLLISVCYSAGGGREETPSHLNLLSVSGSVDAVT